MPALVLVSLAAAPIAAAEPGPPAPPEARYAEANRLLAAGELEKARAIYEDLRSVSAGWAARVGRKLEEARFLEAERKVAGEEAGRLLAERARNPEGVYAELLALEAARRYRRAGMLEAAAEAARLVLPSGRAHAAEAALLAARCEKHRGRAEQAAYDLDRILKRGAEVPGWTACARERLALHRAADEWKAFARLAGTYLKAHPSDPAAVEVAGDLVGVSHAHGLDTRAAIELARRHLPSETLRVEWFVLSARLYEYVDRDHKAAARELEFILRELPGELYDFEKLAAGERGHDAGAQAVRRALARVKAKRAGSFEALAISTDAKKAKLDTPTHALAAAWSAARSGEAERVVRTLSREAARRWREHADAYSPWPYRFTDVRLLNEPTYAGDRATLPVELDGELGHPARPVKRTIRFVRERNEWRLEALP